MAKYYILALVLLCAASVLVAQEPAKTNLDLTVTDQSGAVIPNATTHVESSDHAISFGTKTDNNGQVTFELTPGNYTIKVSFKGFMPSTSQVQIHSEHDQSLRIDLKTAFSSAEPYITSGPLPINMEEISITTFIPLVELTPFPLKNKKLQGSHFKLMPCLIDISCNT
jgi:uncharacterized membrane protein